MERLETNGPSREERIRALQAAAETRVRVALRSIEEAQQLLDQASQALCSVRGVVGEWHKVGALHDRAKDAWHAVQKRTERLIHDGRLILDHEPDAHEAQWAALLGEGD
jgi:hypothetical protein